MDEKTINIYVSTYNKLSFCGTPAIFHEQSAFENFFFFLICCKGMYWGHCSCLSMLIGYPQSKIWSAFQFIVLSIQTLLDCIWFKPHGNYTCR
jgi:hypothetical protein